MELVILQAAYAAAFKVAPSVGRELIYTKEYSSFYKATGLQLAWLAQAKCVCSRQWTLNIVVLLTSTSSMHKKQPENYSGYGNSVL